MTRPKSIFTEPLPDALHRLPGGTKWVAAYYIVGWTVLHGVFIYSLISGRVPLRYSGPFDLRASSPMLFWIFIALAGSALLIFDLFLLPRMWSASRKQKAPNQQPEPTSPFGRRGSS
jgi:hypothetical protein